MGGARRYSSGGREGGGGGRVGVRRGGGGANLAGVTLLGEATAATVIAASFLPSLHKVVSGNSGSVRRGEGMGLGTMMLHREGGEWSERGLVRGGRERTDEGRRDNIKRREAGWKQRRGREQRTGFRAFVFKTKSN